MRLTRSKPFDNPDYIFELKHDGFRAIVYIDDGNAELVSRNQNRFAFGSLKIALAQLPVKNAILDGEVVGLDRNGVSQFATGTQDAADLLRVRLAVAER
jgi:bifunctional non-homologous end joining protein LigD